MSKKKQNNNYKDYDDVREGKDSKEEIGNGRKPKKNRGNNKPNKGASNTEDKSNTRGYLNDAAMYIKDEALRAQVANYPFNTFLGLADTFKTDGGATNVSLPIPTVASIRVNPSLGKTQLLPSGSANSAAINAVARMWYNIISSETGRTSNYSCDDIAILLGAFSELISTIAQAFRIYGLSFNFSLRNRSIPKSLIGATGCDPDTILPRMADFRMRLNTLLIQANSLPIPADVEIFRKNWELFSKAFIDETSSMGQMFLFCEYSTWILDERTNPGVNGSTLKTLLLDGTVDSNRNEKYIFDAFDLLSLIEQQIYALQTATTYNMVYADMMQVLQKRGGKFYQFGYLPELYVVAPEFSEEAISQMHNTIIMGIPSLTVPSGAPSYATPQNDVVADVTIAGVHYNPCLPYVTGFSTEVLLDIPFNDHPTTDEIINYTRYMASWDSQDTSTTWTFLADDYTISDKYVCSYLFIGDSDYKLTDSQYSNAVMMRINVTPQEIHFISTLRHYPTQYYMDGTTKKFVTYVQELNYFTHLSHSWLKRANDICCYGLFQCPLN